MHCVQGKLIVNIIKATMKLKQLRLLVFIFASFLLSANFISCKEKNRDAEIQTEITNKISKEDAMSGLTASVSDGVVTLNGECKDEECKRHCAESVKEIKGVKSVVNNIGVAAPQTTAAPVEITADEPL